MGFSLFGSSGSKSNSSSTSSQTDNRATFGDGGQYGGASSTNVGAGAVYATGSVYQTDGGAFQVVDDVIGKAFAASKEQTSQAFTQLSQQSTALSQAYQDAKGQGINTDKMLMLALGGMALVALLALRKK